MTRGMAPGEDRAISSVALSIAACGLVLTVPCACLSGRFGLGVAIGAVVALINFLALAGLARKMIGAAMDHTVTAGSGASTALVVIAYVGKVLVLFGSLYLLFGSGIVEPLGLIVGLCALVPGIVLGGLLAAPREAVGPDSRGPSANDR